MWFETTFFFVQRALQVIHLALAFSVACVNGSYLYFSSAKLSTNADFIICQVIAGLLVLSSATRLFLGEFKGSISRLIDVLCSALWCVAYGLLKRHIYTLHCDFDAFGSIFAYSSSHECKKINAVVVLSFYSAVFCLASFFASLWSTNEPHRMISEVEAWDRDKHDILGRPMSNAGGSRPSSRRAFRGL